MSKLDSLRSKAAATGGGRPAAALCRATLPKAYAGRSTPAGSYGCSDGTRERYAVSAIHAAAVIAAPAKNVADGPIDCHR